MPEAFEELKSEELSGSGGILNTEYVKALTGMLKLLSPHQREDLVEIIIDEIIIQH